MYKDATVARNSQSDSEAITNKQILIVTSPSTNEKRPFPRVFQTTLSHCELMLKPVSLLAE